MGSIRCTENILYMRPASERWRYIVTSSLIGWAQVQNDSCIMYPLYLDTN